MIPFIWNSKIGKDKYKLLEARGWWLLTASNNWLLLRKITIEGMRDGPSGEGVVMSYFSI